MADKASPEPTAPDNYTAPTEHDFPAKMRVHALAKLLGVTSKQVVLAAQDLGIEVKTAQSSVVRDDAERLRVALTGDAGAPAGDGATTAPATPIVEEAVAPSTVQEPVPDDATAADTSFDPGALFAMPGGDEPAAPATAPETAAVDVPLFLQPETPARADAADGEDTPPRRRRSRRAAGSAASGPDDSTRDGGARESGAGAAPRTETEHADERPAADGGSDDDDSEDGDHPRRRRRGRRGRGRGRGETNNGEGESGDDSSDTDSDDEQSRPAEDQKTGDQKTGDQKSGGQKSGGRKTGEEKAGERGSDASGDDSDASGDAEESSESGDDTESDSGDSTSRRRRRRRRRKGGSEGDGASDDDPPNTVVHEREPRPKARVKDEVQGISGSTRLEAKRQRRRDGRDAGRRRPPILTESEFLARRESVDRVMVVREKPASAEHAALTQVGVLEDGVLVEHFVASSSSASMVGNVYLGRVQNVLPSMEAAFVDIGRGRNGVLYAGEVDWAAAGLGGNSRRIEQALKPGDRVLVQVSKDPVGHKGARLTTQISLAGRFLVYVPGGSSTGISRKLPDTERKRLKEILREVVPAEAGVIIRTAAEGVSAEEIARDVERLQTQWAAIEEHSATESKNGSGQPKSLYEEPDLLVKVVRDLFNEDFSKIVIEGEKAWTTVESYIRTVAPDLIERVERYENTGAGDVFAVHRIDEQLAKALDRKVWLPSGGTLVIDRTEAMTVVDVNTGKFTGSGGNLEETVTRNNLEAAEEIVRQMRLRDIGGMIVVDFIDMVLEANRDLVLRRLTEALGRDRTRHQVSEVTSLGLVQMTRKRLGTGLVEAFSTTCEHCHGRGIIVHADPIEAKHDDKSKNDGGGGGSRRKRGRDRAKSDDASKQDPPTNDDTKDDTSPDASVKRAHPVALAMAAHAHPEDADGTAPAGEAGTAPDAETERSAREAATPESATSSDEAPDTESTGGGRRRSRSRRARRPAGTVAADDGSESTHGDGTVVTAATVAAVTVTDDAPDVPAAHQAAPADTVPDAEVPAASAEPDSASDGTGSGESVSDATVVTVGTAEIVATDEQSGEDAPRPRRRARRVARSAAASSSDAAGTVVVVPVVAESVPAVEESGSDVEPEVAIVARPRRRRAAGRPAGPPVDEPVQ